MSDKVKKENEVEEVKKEKVNFFRKGDFVNYNGEKGQIANILDNDLSTGQQLFLTLYFPATHPGPKTYDMLVSASDVTPWVNT